MTTVDPITLEVVCEGMRAIVKEMRASIIRASFSSAIYELDDFSCALFNPQADMVAQSDDHPGHVMPMPWSVFCAMEDFSGQDGNESIEPGDVILLNDAYRGGTHLNDVTLLYPVFVGGELFIFLRFGVEGGRGCTKFYGAGVGFIHALQFLQAFGPFSRTYTEQPRSHRVEGAGMTDFEFLDA